MGKDRFSVGKPFARLKDYFSSNFKMMLLVVLLSMLFLNLVLPAIFNGPRIMLGADEIKLFDRGKGIANGDIDIYHLWSQPQYVDAYPPGYAIMVAMLLSFIPSKDPFVTSYILKTILFTVCYICYFWLGLLFSRKVAIAAVLFRSTAFVIDISASEHYIYLFSWSVNLTTALFTEITILLTLIFVLRFYYNKGRNLINIIMVFLFGFLHGITHISSFMAFIIFFSAFIIILRFASLRIHMIVRKDEGSIISRASRFLRMFFIDKVLAPLYVLMILPFIVFLLFYLRILLEISEDVYNITAILPFDLPLMTYTFSITVIFILGLLGLFLISRSQTVRVQVTMPFLSIKISRYFIGLYIVCFLLLSTMVNLNPNEYAYSSYSIGTGFSSLLPLGSISIVSILSYTAGMILFILSFIGITGISQRAKTEITFVSLFYIISYFYFTFAFFISFVKPHRSLFFMYILPFLLAFIVSDFKEGYRRLKNLLSTRSFSLPNPLDYRFVKSSNKISIIIVIFFIIIAIIGRANIEPIIVEDANRTNPLKFGSISSPIATVELIDFLRENYVQGESLLCTPDTFQVLYAFLDVVPKNPPWLQEIHSNYQFSQVFYAIYYRLGHSPSEWMENNNASLLVIGSLDSYPGPMSFGYTPINIAMIDSDSRLVKIYEDNANQRVYALNNSAS